MVETTTPGDVSLVLEISRHSSSWKLVRVTALVLRFINKLKDRKGPKKGNDVSTDEEMATINLGRGKLISEENAWVKSAQLDLRKQDNFYPLKRTLNIVEDENKMFRCIGRLENSDLDESARKPLILPKEHELTRLIIKDCYIKVHHSGLRESLVELRSRYWVPKGRQVVKKQIN